MGKGKRAGGRQGYERASQVALVVKEPICQCRRHKRGRFNPWVRRSPGGGHGDSLQYSCLDNPMDGRIWQATVHWVTKSQTQLKQLIMHTRRGNRIKRYKQPCIKWLDSYSHEFEQILKNRGSWSAAVHRVTESHTQLSDWIITVYKIDKQQGYITA